MAVLCTPKVAHLYKSHHPWFPALQIYTVVIKTHWKVVIWAVTGVHCKWENCILGSRYICIFFVLYKCCEQATVDLIKF